MTERPRLSVAAAVAEYVGDGACVYIGNFGAQLFCVGHQLIRQGRRDLHIVAGSGGLLLDQLIGAGAVREATFSHCWGAVGPAPASNFRRALEGGAGLVVHELSLGMLVAALTAGAWDVPFMPIRDHGATGYAAGDWTGGMIAEATSPLGRSAVIAALRPDVAFVHADVADAAGNAAIRGPVGEAAIAAQAAQRTVIVAEQVVDAACLRAARPNVAGVVTAAVVEQPGAVKPDGAAGRYPRDVEAHLEYARAARSPAGFAAWLERVRERPRERA